MKRVDFIKYKGKRILFLDFSGLELNEFMEGVKQAEKIVRSQPQKSLLTLTDMTGNNYMPTSNKIINDSFRDNALFVKASAAVGVTGIKKILVKIMEKYAGRRMCVFDNLVEAKDWLADQ